MSPVKVGLLGLGTVGGGTVQVLRRNADEISRRAGREIQVTHALVRDATKARDVVLDGIAITEDPLAVVDNPDIDIVAELIGGIEPAQELVMRAIANSKHVVTANKALIATAGNAIFEAAQSQGVMVAFEAAVAGGIPVIKALRGSAFGQPHPVACGHYQRHGQLRFELDAGKRPRFPRSFGRSSGPRLRRS